MVLMKREEVLAATRLCYTSIFNKMKAGTFPLSRKIGARAVVWYKDEIDAWLTNLPCTTFPAKQS